MSVEERKLRDNLKAQICKNHGNTLILIDFLTFYLGVTLIEVPYWWDRKKASLEATIHSHRPDLFSQSPPGKEIAVTPPNTTQRRSLKATKQLMTATLWEEEKDPTGW
jgi:hypothetical protein